MAWLRLTPWAVFYLASGLWALLLALLISFRGREPLRRSLTLMTMMVAGLSLAQAAVQLCRDPHHALVASRIELGLSTFAPVVTAELAGALTGRPRWGLNCTLLSLAAVMALLAIFSPWALDGVRHSRYGLVATAAPLYPLWIIELSLVFILPLSIFDLTTRQRLRYQRHQLRRLMVPALLGLLGLLDVLPVLGIDMPSIGWGTAVASMTALFWALVRNHLVDLHIALRRALWWMASSIVGAALFLLLLLPAATLHTLAPRQLVLLLAALLVGMRLWMATGHAELERLVGRRHRDLDTELGLLTESASALQTTEALGESIDRFLQALDRRLSALVVIERSGQPRVVASAWGAVPAPPPGGRLFEELAAAGPLISREEARQAGQIEIERACLRYGSEYLVPVRDADELLGIVAIAPRPDREAADAFELGALHRMGVIVTTALASARLYERLHGLHRELENKAEARRQSLARALEDLRGAEQRLVQSEKLSALGKIVSGVAADLVDEVRTVQGQTGAVRKDAEIIAIAAQDRLRREPALADRELDEITTDLTSLLDAVEEGGRRALAIADNLARFAPTGAQEAPPPPRTSVRLDELVEGTLKLCASHLRQVQVARGYDPLLPALEVESGPIGQVVLNLVLNASQAMQGQGRLELVTRRCELNGKIEGGAELLVRDSGPGIEPEVLPRIFEPFFSTKSSSIGTGLGLSVSYGIIERHGGRILVDSVPGGGATFRVQLPID